MLKQVNDSTFGIYTSSYTFFDMLDTLIIWDLENL